MAVYKRTRNGNTVWQAKVYFGGRAGRQVTRTAPTRAMAKQAEAQLLAERAARAGITHPDATVHELASVWWTRHVQDRVRPGTAGIYAAQLRRRIIPTIGNTPATELTPPMLQEWVNQLRRDGETVRMTNQALQTLKTILSRSVADGTLKTNPAEGVRKLPEAVRVVEIPTATELAHLLKNAPNEQTRRMAAVLAATGVRIGELFALEWRDIRADHIRVERQVDRLTLERVPTKTKAQRRVPLLTTATEAFPQRGNPTDLVFPNSQGGPWRYSNWNRRQWRAMVTAAGLDHLRPHDLRHRFASVAIESGASVVAVARWLGHANPTMTLNVYGHLYDVDEAAQAARMDALLVTT